MQLQEKAGQTLTEPITIDELKSYLGYTMTDQDSFFSTLITAVRKWVERYTGQSMIEKTYQAQFSKYDLNDNWLTLPIGPVKEISSVLINNVSVSYEKRGLTETEIMIYGGISGHAVTVEYIASVTDNIEPLKIAVLRLCANLFVNKRDATEIAESKVDFTTKSILKSL